MSLTNSLRRNHDFNAGAFKIGAGSQISKTSDTAKVESVADLGVIGFDEPERNEELEGGINVAVDRPDFNGQIGASGGTPVTVRAEAGDNLYRIGLRYGVKADAMLAANPQYANGLPEGADVRIPGWEQHTVVKDDTVYSLSGGDEDLQARIRDVNGLSGNTLRLGATIAVPTRGASSTRPAAPTTTTTPPRTNANTGSNNNPIRTQRPPRPSEAANDESVRHTTADGTFTFPVGGEQFNVGYDDNWNTWGEARVNNSDFGADRGHKGNDIFGPRGAPIVAAVSGEVVKVSTPKTNKAGGNAVTIEDANGDKYYYAHLTRADVSVGDQVTSGEKIGTLGNTGNPANKTEPHLHFEIWPDGDRGQAFDPFSKLEQALNGE